jgi:general secretion pathway protein A
MQRSLAAGIVLLAGGVLAFAAFQRHQPDIKAAAVQQTVAKPAVPATKLKAAGLPNDFKATAPLPDSLAWTADEPLARSKVLAYAALFQAWGANYQGADACLQAESLGLRCRSGRGGLAELRASNRPAVLQMRDNQDQEFFATLTQLGPKTASFAIGARTTTVALGALASQWSGYYSLLWRVPPTMQRHVQEGDRGPAVEWLSKQLAQVQGGTAKTGKDLVFDEGLARQVKQFQFAQGLTPDGVVGPQTLMRLAGAADQAAPKLISERGEK